MNFLADESLDYPIVDALRQNGHDVYSIFEKNQGISDNIVLSLAKEQNRIILTVDKDFGELAFRLKLVSSGIILLRIPEYTIEEKITTIIGCIAQFQEHLPLCFCVITDKKIRFTPLVSQL